MPILFRRPQAGRGYLHQRQRQRQRPTWEERARAALAAAREVEEDSGESVPTRPSEVNVSRRLFYGPRYILPGTEGSPREPKLQQREEPCAVLQGNISLHLPSLQLPSLVLEASASPDSVTASPYFTLSFVVHSLVPLTVNLHWLATEEWAAADGSDNRYPRYVSRVSLQKSYPMDAGRNQLFTLPRADWLEPTKEPYRTLLSSDWQARNAAVPTQQMLSAEPIHSQRGHTATTAAVALAITSAPSTTEQTDTAVGSLPRADCGHDSIEMNVLQSGGNGHSRVAEQARHHGCIGIAADTGGHPNEIEELTASTEKTPAYGLVIELVDRRPRVAVTGNSVCRPDSQTSFIDFYKEGQSHVTPRCVKQKYCLNGALYLQHEIFGLNEALEQHTALGNDPHQCAICLSDERDTVLLPCRHLCMCRECANTYRQQSNKCPICRTVVETILHIQASD
ncbi:hypothetical protein GQ54DRAFT_338704 [Martensiomyces pterosporus]|nr:hypothetical protein GQ54DRAFT_338704 [Martensiomyces pterosporus]